MAFLKNIYFRLVSLFFRLGAHKRLPVLLYHSIADDGGRLSMSAAEFEKQLAWLKANGYQSVLPDQVDGFLQSKKIPARRVVISFDDGFKDNYHTALPLLEKYGFRAAFFIAAKFVGGKADYCRDSLDRNRPMMSAEEIKDLKARGHFVGNHFYSHRNLSELAAAEVAAEFEAGENFLSNLLSAGEAAKFVAYPRNRLNDTVLAVMKERGVRLAFAGQPGLVDKNSSSLMLPRIEPGSGKPLAVFKAELAPGHYWLKNIFNFFRKNFGRGGFYFFSILVFLRIIFLFISLAGWPAGTGLADSWWTTYGGDELGYYNSAAALLRGEFLPKAHPLGYPLFLAPFIKFFNFDSFLALSSFNVFFGGVILSVLAAGLVYLLGLRILKNKFSAYLLSLLFCIYPYFFFFIFKVFSGHDAVMNQFVSSRFGQLMFYFVASDPWSLILMLISLLWFLDIFKNKKEAGNFGLGFVSSWAAISRIQNAAILPLYFLFFILAKRYRSAAVFFAGSLPLLFFQAWANLAGQGSLWSTVYGLKKGSDLSIPMISWFYPLRVIKYPLDHGPLLLVILVVFLALIFLGGRRLIKRDRLSGWIIIAYLLSNSIPLLLLEPTMRNPRYFLPVIPVVFLLLFVGLENLSIFLKEKIWLTKK